MRRHIMGISAYFHDSAAAILRDGEILAAAQEERFSRRKHDPRLPVHSMNYCLEEAFIDAADLDAIAYAGHPLLTLDRIVKSAAMAGSGGEAAFLAASPSALGTKLWIQDHIHHTLKTLGKPGRLLYVEHHVAHAASAFFPSPFERSAILTLDGVGEWATATYGRGDRNRIELWKEIRYPHSLGLLYSAFTHHCGFKVNSGEYKLMGLAPYGRPIYRDVILKNLIDVKNDGSFRLNLDYFAYVNGLTMTTPAFDTLFDGPPREPESAITRREMNLSASIQIVLEEIVLRLARHLRKETGETRLVLSGGVALNCVSNGRLMREGIFDDLWIQPAAGDAGNAVGAALAIEHLHFKHGRTLRRPDAQRSSLLGPSWSRREVRAFLDRREIPHHLVLDPGERARRIAQALAEGHIAGFFAGRMEFGPRALGARSILADPRTPDMQSRLNLKIKFRESFRPFAPVVREERLGAYFELDRPSPYMLLVAPVRKERQRQTDTHDFDTGNDNMIPVINQCRSDLPAVTHVDYSARVQTVSADGNPALHAVLTAFEALTGCGVLVNTSFNVRGEPIVCSPGDAYRCFMRTQMDVLVLGDYLLFKAEQPVMADDEPQGAVHELD